MLGFRRDLFGFLPLIAAFALACGGESLTVPPTTGTLQVTTSTGGAEPDPDGYVVQVDGGPEQAIGASGTLQLVNVDAGTHVVQLSGVAANCSVGGDNPRTVGLTGGETESVTFEVTCTATSGSLQVSAATGGPSPDLDGYNVTVDGIDRGTLSTNGSLAVAAVSPGDHLVGLSGLAGNCQVQGDNPRTAAVATGSSTTVAFVITCTTPPSNVGSLRITTATTGGDQDPNGYSFAVDGGAPQPIAISTSTTVSQIGVGPHSVSLSGVAANCTVQGTNPRAVTVASGATAEVSFAVTCSATTGTIRVNITTSGSPTDPDGYTVRLDGAAPGRAMGTNESADFPGVAPGSHSVALTEVAPNCTVAGGPAKTVTVAVGATAEVSFAVTCAATTGSIKVSTVTTGSNPDNSYSVSVDGGTSTPIAGNTSVTLNGIAAGTRSVTLSSVATNCTVGGTNPRQVTVTAGQTVNADFAITCAAAVQARIAFVSENPGVHDIFTVEPDGNPRSNLTDGLAGQAETPEWSPDHSKIAFQGGDTGGDIWVVNADGSGLKNVTQTPSGIGIGHEWEKGPRWSPDGSRILFTRTILLPPDGDVLETDVWVMKADGSEQSNLTRTGSEGMEGGYYTWSPDGTQIAFTSARGGPSGIWVMGADGSNPHQLADGISFDPDWSPDGKRIAFLRQGAEIDVWAMDADGTNEDQLTNQPGDLKAEVSWSPDGSKIVYRFAASPGSSDIWTVNADGNGEFNVTKSGGDNTDPVWSPDSRQIAFVFGMGSGQPVVQVINADGTGLQPNVSGRAAPSFRPDW